MQDESAREEMRLFLLSAIAMSVAVWDVTFFLGVFNTIFFQKVFAVWVAATAVFLGSFFIPDDRLPLPYGWLGRIVLALPSLWLVAALVDDRNIEHAFTDSLILWTSLAAGLLSLPYLLYIGIIIVTPGVMDLRNPRLIAALLAVVAVIGTIGFVVGRNNHVFLTCWDFRVSGNALPPHCRSESRDGTSPVSPARLGPRLDPRQDRGAVIRARAAAAN